MLFRSLQQWERSSHCVGWCRWMSCGAIVMSFGDGSHGALGLPSSVAGIGSDAYEPTPVPGLPPDVTGVAAGHYHSLAVTSRGHLWAWGRNLEFQLGRGLLCSRETWNEPRRVEGLDQVGVRSAFASGVVSAAIGFDGSLWVCGKSKRGQLGLGNGITEAPVLSKVKTLEGEEIIKVSFGWGHTLALTKDGKLFGWGYASDGRLGKMGGTVETSPLDFKSGISKISEQTPVLMLETTEKVVSEAIEKEKDMPLVWEPQLIEEVKGVEVMDVACGLDHSLILCGNGTLLSGGSNVYGQLGRATQDIELLPVDIRYRPRSIASGLGHSLAICQIPSSKDSNEFKGIVTWGWNASSQLGREGSESVPMVANGLAEETPVSISGGRAHSVAVTSEGEVWAWGCGRNGRLGLGSLNDEPEPVLVELGCPKVLQAASGFDHTLLLTTK